MKTLSILPLLLLLQTVPLVSLAFLGYFWCYYDLCWVIVRCTRKWLVAWNLRQVWGEVFYYIYSKRTASATFRIESRALKLRLRNTTLRQGQQAQGQAWIKRMALSPIEINEAMHGTLQSPGGYYSVLFFLVIPPHHEAVDANRSELPRLFFLMPHSVWQGSYYTTKTFARCGSWEKENMDPAGMYF